ncbi:MAG: BON domain-containing protein [Armatimonadetes bacterium]|nr:BON domain-containing protein [Armatimonadota bacterium]
MPMIFDEAMGQIIRERLMQDRRTAGLTVEICCNDGCICLVGQADSVEQRDAAIFLIEGLTGVRSVMDQIVVRNPAGSVV